MTSFTDCLYGECPSCKAKWGAMRALKASRLRLGMGERLYCDAIDCPSKGEDFSFEEIDEQDESDDPIATMQAQVNAQQSAAERAFERSLNPDNNGPTLAEQHQAAWDEHRRLHS